MDITTLAAAKQYTDTVIAKVSVDGIKGDTGPKGDTGDTYELTNQDKSDIAVLVLESIPNGNEVSF